MQTSIDRIQLLRGDFSSTKCPIRPPWALPESVFIEKCSRCDDCIKACTDRLIIRGQGGFPEMDFSHGGCDFCSDCVAACEAEALYRPTPDTTPWSYVVSIKDSCLSLKGTLCRTCGDACDKRAIKFSLQVGGRAQPVLNQELCTGCGECLFVCPVKSIEISSNNRCGQAT